MSQIGVGAATLSGIFESVPSGKNSHLSSKRHLAIQVTHILVLEPHTAMGDGRSNRPAVGCAMDPRGRAFLNRDPGLAVMSISAQAVAMKGDPVAAQGIVGPLFLHPLASHRMHPHRMGIF